MTEMSGELSQEDTFTFIYDSWSNLELVNGIIPAEINDGDDVYITGDGLCLDRVVKTGDYIRFYENKSKFILNRLFDISDIPPVEVPEVSGNVENAGSKAVSGEAVVNYVPTQISSFMSNMSNYNKMLWDGNTLQPKLSSDSNNMVQTRSDGLWAGIDTSYVFSNINEKTELYNSSYISLDMINNNVFYINTSGSSCSLYIYNLIAGPSNVSRTYTFIIENTYSISWPNNFKWLDETPPDLELGKVLVVTGIYTPNAGSYIFCTYNYFIKE